MPAALLAQAQSAWSVSHFFTQLKDLLGVGVLRAGQDESLRHLAPFGKFVFDLRNNADLWFLTVKLLFDPFRMHRLVKLLDRTG